MAQCQGPRVLVVKHFFVFGPHLFLKKNNKNPQSAGALTQPKSGPDQKFMFLRKHSKTAIMYDRFSKKNCAIVRQSS